MSGHTRKYLFLLITVFLCIASDQVSKQWAELRLSSPNPPIGPPHSFQIHVPAQAAGQTIHAFLSQNLVGTTPEQIDNIVSGGALINDRKNYQSTYTLAGGENITITARRDVEVINNFFHFRYTRNPGAAFGFLAKSSESWRRTFFIAISIVSIVIMLGLYHKTHEQQRLLRWSLALILGGALGNFIDRLAYGWVIDFIDWHYYREYTWPTFNIADAQITIGVALMAIEIFTQKTTPEGEQV